MSTIALTGVTALPAAFGAAAADPIWSGYKNAIVIDACGGVGREGRAPDHPTLTNEELTEAKKTGLTLINYTVGTVGSYANDFKETIDNIAWWDREIANHSDVLMKVTSGAQIDEAKRTNRVGIMFGFQDTTMYGENLDRFDLFHNFGVRIIQLTYNRRNLMGDGCLETGNAGLSTLGREMVAKMNERGCLVDLSHCGQRTTREGIETSKRPVAITHSGCTAIADMPRNKRDEEMKLLADRGGVIGIYIMPYLRTSGQVMADDLIKHIDYAVNVCGEDHVGIGTDGTTSSIKVTPEYKKAFADEIAERQKRGISAPGERPDSFTFAPDLNTTSRFEKIAALLSQKGYSDARIEKILGANFARLFRDVIV
jgi:membrane dipeptidase